jgi:hypothetical protein
MTLDLDVFNEPKPIGGSDMKEETGVSLAESTTHGGKVLRRSGWWHRLSINITPAERIGRIAIGAAGIVVGAILLTSAGSALAVILEVLLVLAGIDLVVTGALGHCPLYAKLGHVPKSLRRQS